MSPLPDHVDGLLRQTIGSFEELEILLLLRVEREQPWTAKALAARLSLPTSTTVEELEQLRRAGLLRIESSGNAPAYQYSPETVELGRAVEELASLYRDERLAVIQAMNKNAIERVRTHAIRTFADAFLIYRRKKP